MTSIIKTFFSSLNDLEKAQELITPDCRFIAVREEQYEEMPLYGAFVGASGLQEFVGGLLEHFDTQSFLIDHVIENETLGAAFGRFEHLVKPTGKTFKSHWGVLCTFESGKIASYRFYEDNAALEEAFGRQTQNRESIE